MDAWLVVVLLLVIVVAVAAVIGVLMRRGKQRVLHRPNPRAHPVPAIRESHDDRPGQRQGRLWVSRWLNLSTGDEDRRDPRPDI